MIVRISGEGQFDVPDDQMARLNELDESVERAVANAVAAQDAFRTALNDLLDAVRGGGAPVASDELVPSDLVLPHGEATVDDVRDALADDGLVPG
jgi:hypothetical protein